MNSILSIIVPFEYLWYSSTLQVPWYWYLAAIDSIVCTLRINKIRKTHINDGIDGGVLEYPSTPLADNSFPFSIDKSGAEYLSRPFDIDTVWET